MIKHFSVSKITIVIIIALAFILRFYKLGQVPLSLNWDETSNAYNAYSILKTGRDEYGKLLPAYNRSFDDYKPPMYMYLDIPSVAVFGLTPFAARFPSALFGTLTVLLVYLLTKKLFVDHKFHFSIAHISALILTISTWHVQVSRVGFEANIGLFFAVAAFTSFIYSIRSNQKGKSKNTMLMILSAILFGLSAYSYHSERIFIPLMFFATLIIFRKEIMAVSKKFLSTFVIILILTVLPLLFLVPKDAVSNRFESITLTSYTEDVEKSVELINQDKEKYFPPAKILHNRRTIIGLRYLKNYLVNFDPNFLFTKGDDNFRHHIENMGMLYLFQLPLVIIGFYYLIKKRSRESIFLIVWLLISPIAAAPSNASPHALRSLTMVIPLTIFSAVGFTNILKNLHNNKIFIVFSLFAFTFSLLTYLHNYQIHYSHDFASWWQYGYFEAAQKTEVLKKNYQSVVVSPNIEQAYIFYLFATRFDPALYQKTGSNVAFDKLRFSKDIPTNSDQLYVNTSLPDDFKIVDTIYYPDGQPALQIGHPKPILK